MSRVAWFTNRVEERITRLEVRGETEKKETSERHRVDTQAAKLESTKVVIWQLFGT